MTATRIDPVLREVEHLLADHALAEWSDLRLLQRFIQSRDGAAFETLLHRHGPMVLRVCRGVLRNSQDVEDAFQATFLVLACSAAKIRNPASLASFLYGAAYRVAVKARARALRRQTAERMAPMRTETVENGRNGDIPEATLHEELARLPENYRQVLVLCYLEGRTHEQAAQQLGWPIGSVSYRLRRACELLRERLLGRGVALSVTGSLVAAMAAPSQATVPAALAQATLRAVNNLVPGSALLAGACGPAVELANEVLRTMNAFKPGRLAALLLLIGILAGGTAMFARSDPAPGEKQTGPGAFDPAPVAAGVDRFGDPLPPDAIARLGTVRLRHGGPVCALAFSPDGKSLVSTDSILLSLWDVSDGRQRSQRPGQQGYLNAVAFSADGKLLATVSADGSILVNDFQRAGRDNPSGFGPDRLRLRPDAGNIWFLAFTPDGCLVSGTADGRLTLWDIKAEKEVRRFGTVNAKELNRFALSPDGKVVAGVCRDREVVLWDVSTGEKLASLAGHEKARSLAFSPDGKTLAVGDETNTIRVWGLKDWQVTRQLVGQKEPQQSAGVGDAIRSLAFTSDGKTLASVGDHGDGTIRIWDVQTGKEVRRLKSAFGDGDLITLSPDDRTLAVTGMNHTIRLWDITTGKELAGDLGSQGSVGAVAVTPDSKQVAVAGTDGVIRVWDRASSKEVRAFRGHQRQIAVLAFSPDGSQLVSAGAYDSARLWDVKTGKELRKFQGVEGNVHGVSHVGFSPDGKRIALTTYAPSVQLVDIATGEVERTLAKGSLIDRVVFSPDGKLLAGGGFDQTMHAWDTATGEEKWSAKCGGSVAAVAFLPDGRTVAAGLYTSKILFWETATGREVRQITGPGGVFRAVAISPNARLLAAGGDAGPVTLYELATGQPARKLAGHVGHVWSLTFAPDGRSLVSGSWDATALVWDLTGQGLARKQPNPLTDAELEARWTALGKAASEEAYTATLSLASVPRQAVGFLRARLAPGTGADTKVAKWLADLDDDGFEVRETASRELARLGRAIEAELQRVREATKSAEVRRRVDELLEKMGEGEKANVALRAQRAVAVLELTATPEARELLEHLSTKAPDEVLRRSAKGALERLARRP